tara:strand:+ start:242 stop:514 length:273 start_codon:yes stop_codon:yes gene_type:complete
MENEQKRKLENWNCEKCNIRIGVIDPEAKQLRIRYKDFVLAWEWSCSIGSENPVDDKISLLCRRCAWVNEKTRSELIDTKIKQTSSRNDK